MRSGTSAWSGGDRERTEVAMTDRQAGDPSCFADGCNNPRGMGSKWCWKHTRPHSPCDREYRMLRIKYFVERNGEVRFDIHDEGHPKEDYIHKGEPYT